MSRLSKFLSNPKEVEIQGEKFKVYPLRGKHMALFMKESKTPEEQAELAYQLVFESLKESEPDITIDEIKNLPFGIINELLLAVADVSGLSEDERIKSIKANIIQRNTK
jgi:hypothetical protein